MSASPKRPVRTSLILALGVAMGAAVTLTQGVFATRDNGARALPLDEMRTFVEILNLVKSDYVEAVNDDTLLENAVRGMLDGLDPHSAYLSAEEFREVTISTSGKFGGLGIEVQMQDGFVRVVAPIDDTPADRAGLKAGDLIIRIDSKPVKGMSLIDAVKLMRGEPGSEITLTILRESEPQPFKVTIERDIIRVKSVKSKMLDPGYGYVRITQFSSQTTKNLEQALKDLNKEAGGNVRGLILDLRNNPGGVLNGAVEVSDAFLESGVVVSIKGRIDEVNKTFNATAGDSIDGAPIVVLVNGGSASASEIVAGALQDHRRAVIMGEKTFVKGSVQTILPLQNSAALKLTTARYYTPNGRSIQAQGITPDIGVRPVQLSEAEEEDKYSPIKESDLSGSLINENGEESTSDEKTDNTEENGLKLAKTDYALYEALNLLKGLVILGKK